MHDSKFPIIKLALPDLLEPAESGEHLWSAKSNDKDSNNYRVPFVSAENFQRNSPKLDSEIDIFESYYEDIFSIQERNQCIAPSSSYDGQSFKLFSHLYLQWLNRKFKNSIPEPIVCFVCSERKGNEKVSTFFPQSTDRKLERESYCRLLSDNILETNDNKETRSRTSNGKNAKEEAKDIHQVSSTVWNDFFEVYANFSSFILKSKELQKSQEGLIMKNNEEKSSSTSLDQESIGSMSFTRSFSRSITNLDEPSCRVRLKICFILANLDLNLDFTFDPQNNNQDFASYAASVLSMLVLTLTKSEEGTDISMQPSLFSYSCLASLRNAGVISILLKLLYQNYHKSFILKSNSTTATTNKIIILNSLSILSCLISMQPKSFSFDFMKFNIDTIAKEVIAEKSPLLLDVPFRKNAVKKRSSKFNGITVLLYTLEISLKDRDFNLVCATVEILVLLLQKTKQEVPELHIDILHCIFTYDRIRSRLYEMQIFENSELPLKEPEPKTTKIIHDEAYNYEKCKYTYFLDQLQLHLNESQCDVAFQGPVSRNLRQTKLIVNMTNALKRLTETLINHYKIAKVSPALKFLTKNAYFQQTINSLARQQWTKKTSLYQPINFQNCENNVNKSKYFTDRNTRYSSLGQSETKSGDKMKKRCSFYGNISTSFEFFENYHFFCTDQKAIHSMDNDLRLV